MRKNILKAFSVVLAFVLAFTPVLAGAEGVVTYYAQIKGLTAIYDQYTETLDFDIEFSGAVFESHSFTVSVFCTEYIDGEWIEDTEYLTQSFLYGNSHTAPTHFTGTVGIDKADFFGSRYKDFTLFVSGDEVDAGSAIGGKYYTLDSANAPITLKDAPNGDFYTLSAELTPKESVKGGTVVLTLYLDEINPNLSGGLCDVGFTLCYDKELLALTQAEFTAEKSVCSFSDGTPTADGIRLGLTSETGIKHDRSVAIKLYFRTLKGGTASFSVKDLMGKDVASHSFTNGGYALAVTAQISDKTAILGDANGDGLVNSIDAATVLKYDAGIIDVIENADVNRDGNVNSIDAAMILKYDAGLIDDFNV